MPRKVLFSLTLVFLCSICLGAAGHPDLFNELHGKFVPPSGKTLLLIGQDRDTIQHYIQAIGIIPAGFMTYTSIQELKGLDSSTDYGSGIQHAQYFVRKYPNTVIQIGLYMVGALKDVISGVYDGHIQKLGTWIKKSRCPVYLRIGYEFDNPTNFYDKEDYKKAFRYIVDKLRARRIENVVFVWHSAAFMEPKPVMDWYPGDEYVDWFAVSFFATPQQLSVREVAQLAKEHGKPFMIAEAAPAGVKTFMREESFRRWLQVYFDIIKQNNVAVACYINSDWDSLPMFRGQNWGDSRLQTTPVIKDLWMKEITDPKYLQSPSGSVAK